MEIPKTAKRVFHGVLHDVYQWQQRMFDGSSETFELIYRQPSTDVIATVGDRIIVLTQEQPDRRPYPSLPGGRVEANEKPIEAAARELLEEAGYKAQKIEQFQQYQGFPKYYFEVTIFIAKNCTKVAEPTLDVGEKMEIQLVSFDNFLQLCRKTHFSIPADFKFLMYEALLDKTKKEALRKRIFGS